MKNKILFTLLALSIGLFFFDQMIMNSAQTKENAPYSQAKTGIHVGEKATDLQLFTSDGELVSLSNFHGKFVFINFWASWCPPCRAEMPHIQEFFNEYKNDDFVILSVNLTHLEKNKGSAQTFIDKNQYTFPVIYDEQGDVDAIYKANTIPTSIIVDPEGVIHHRIVGPISKERLEKVFTDLQHNWVEESS